jgi:hypothetical protein
MRTNPVSGSHRLPRTTRQRPCAWSPARTSGETPGPVRPTRAPLTAHVLSSNQPSYTRRSRSLWSRHSSAHLLTGNEQSSCQRLCATRRMTEAPDCRDRQRRCHCPWHRSLRSVSSKPNPSKVEPACAGSSEAVRSFREVHMLARDVHHPNAAPGPTACPGLDGG